MGRARHVGEELLELIAGEDAIVIGVGAVEQLIGTRSAGRAAIALALSALPTLTLAALSLPLSLPTLSLALALLAVALLVAALAGLIVTA